MRSKIPYMIEPQGHYRVDPRSAAFPPLASTWRVVFLVTVVLSVLGFVAAVGLWTAAIASNPQRPDDALMGIGAAAFVVTVLFVYVHAFIGIAWVHKAWSWLPWDQRYSRSWKSWITPAQAALFLLIPYFQYYWMFVVNPGLCDALDRLRVRFPTREPAPKTLAIVACVTQIVIPLPVGAILWAIYMSKIEAMTREMSASAGARAGYGF